MDHLDEETNIDETGDQKLWNIMAICLLPTTLHCSRATHSIQTLQVPILRVRCDSFFINLSEQSQWYL